MTSHDKNEAVAVKLGWTYDEKFQDWGNPEDIKRPLPDFCHSIEAAWGIVDHIHADELLLTVRQSTVGCSFSCIRNGIEHTIVQFAATTPMAIVDAFLRLP